MKTKTLILALTAMVFALTSCDKVISPSGKITQENYDFSGYDAIDISDAFNATITFMPTAPSIVIEADDNIQEHIDIKVISDRLYIGLDRNHSISGPATLRAIINTTEAIDAIYASGATNIVLADEFEATTARIEASGASRVSGDVDFDNFTAHLSGASIFELEGSADNTNANLSGASTFGNYDLIIQDLDVDLSGASNARLTVENEISVDASGGSSLIYKGNPDITHQNLTGASTLIDAN